MKTMVRQFQHDSPLIIASSSSDDPLFDKEALLSMIQAMRQREMKYRVSNYMPRYTDKENLDRGNSSSNENIDLECRRRMCQWSYRIIDHCNFRRETVAIAMNMLDRFVDACSKSPISQVTRSTYQLAALTSLYIAIKVFEPVSIHPQTIAALSSGAFTTEHIEALEFTTLLPTLQWLLHPPTAISFGQYYVALILRFIQMRVKNFSTMNDYAVDEKCIEPISLDKTRVKLIDLLQFQLEASIFDYELIQIDPSILAYAALLNCVESLNYLSIEVRVELDDHLHEEIFCVHPNELTNRIIQDLQVRLQEIIRAFPTSDNLNDPSAVTAPQVSPRGTAV